MSRRYELTVLFECLTNYDREQYNNLQTETRGVLYRLMCPDTGLVGVTANYFLLLLRAWRAAPDPKGEWMLLALFKAPMTDQRFAKQSRGHILRFNTAHDRQWSFSSGRLVEAYCERLSRLSLRRCAIAPQCLHGAVNVQSQYKVSEYVLEQCTYYIIQHRACFWSVTL